MFCKKCKEKKDLSELYCVKYRVCKKCHNLYKIEWRRSYEGKKKVIFHKMKRNSKKRNHTPPLMTFNELNLFLEQNNYDFLHKNWKESGYDKNLSPSVDRIDDYKTYCLNNIRLVTWEENNKKGHQDVYNGINNKRSISVIGIKDKEKIEFNSLSAAGRHIGSQASNISVACRKKRGTHFHKGYEWYYKKNYIDDCRK